MIDWKETELNFGYSSNNGLVGKRPKVIVICDECPKSRIIAIRVKSKIINNQLSWLCSSCALKKSSSLISSNMKKQWENEEYRESITNKSLEMWKDQEYRDKHQIAVIDAMKNIDMSSINIERYKSQAARNKLRIASFALWNNLEFRERHSQIMNSNEIIKKCSDGAIKAWQDPEYRNIVTSKLSEIMNQLEMKEHLSNKTKQQWLNHRDELLTASSTPDVKIKLSNVSKENWENTEYRQNITNKLTEFYNNQDNREILSKRSIKLWEDDEYRTKIIEAMNQPEIIDKLSKINIERWKDDNYKKQMSEMVKRKWKESNYREKMAAIRAAQSENTSTQQLMLYQLLDDLKITHIKDGPESLIGYYRFDCIVPSHNILIECQGDYWHDEIKNPKSTRNDRAKFTYISKYFPQYRIVYIWEREFYQKDRVINRLKSLFGLINDDIIDFDFKDVKIKKINKCSEFLALYHYIGPDRGGQKFGAFLNDKLIGVAVFSSPLRQNTAKQFNLPNNKIFECSRFCIHPSYQKKNFASWFLTKCSKFFDNYLLYSYADQTVGHLGIMYKACGWKLHHIVPSDYWYCDNDGFVMHKRTLYGRAISLKMTEAEFALKYNYNKVFGGPKLCFIRPN